MRIILLFIFIFISPNLFAFENAGELLEACEVTRETRPDDAHIKTACTFYIIGILDGVKASYTHTPKEHREICLPETYKVKQMFDVVKQHLKQHPEVHHIKPNIVVYGALMQAFPCWIEYKPKE